VATKKCRPGASALTKAEDIVAVSNWTKNYPYTPQSMPKPEQHLFCGNVAVNGLPIFCMFLRDAKVFVWVPIEQFSLRPIQCSCKTRVGADSNNVCTGTLKFKDLRETKEEFRVRRRQFGPGNTFIDAFEQLYDTVSLPLREAHANERLLASIVGYFDVLNRLCGGLGESSGDLCLVR
jgi:hypothetical protein